MKREDLQELHFIARITNIASIIQHGLLCKNLADRLRPAPRSFAIEEVQARRHLKPLPNGFTIHQCANLYIWARNPAMYYATRHGRPGFDELCIVRFHPSILDFPNAIMSDRNAACSWSRFDDPEKLLKSMDWQYQTVQYWRNHIEEYEKEEHKAKMCAELLIPHRVGPEAITGFYVPNKPLMERVRALTELEVICRPYLFFQSSTDVII